MFEPDITLKKQLSGNKSPAVQYMIFDEYDVIHKFQTGFADIKEQKKISWNTTFNAFSVTKTFTALAILQLVDKGLLDLDDSAKIHMAEFPYPEEITIRQLLTHSAGIPNPNPLAWIHLDAEHQSFDRDAFFAPIIKKYSKTKSAPNQKFAYSNLGYFLLGQLIENVSGQSYEEYIRRHILEPLDIGSQELNFEICDKKLQAKGYQKRFSIMNAVLGLFLDKNKYMATPEGSWKPFKNYYVNGPSYGGLIGCLDGFRKYIQALLDPDSPLITPGSKKQLFSENFTSSGKATGMCLAWFKGSLNGKEYYAHPGGGGGYYDEIRIYPDLGIGSVIMYNRSGMTDERILDNLDTFYINKN